MTSRLVLVRTAPEAPATAPGQTVVVIDTAWRPDPQSRPDLLALAPAVHRALAARDPFTDARVLLDAWAAAVDLDGATTVDGVAWWYRHRLTLWLGLSSHLHWLAVLDELRAETWPSEAIAVPAAEPSLLEVARLLAARDGLEVEVADAPPDAEDQDAATGSTGRPPLWAKALRRLGGSPEQTRGRELDRRRQVLDARVATLREEGGGHLLVLMAASVAQAADLPEGSRLVDPFLEPVARACAGTRLDPVTLLLGVGPEDDTTWPSVEANPRCLPESALEAFWGRTDDVARARQDGAAVAAAVAALPLVPMTASGVDVSGLVRDRLARIERRRLPKTLTLGRRAARMMADLQPAALLLINEYNRREYVVAARSTGIPSFAVQHGIIYPGHVGYVLRRTPGVVRPTRTFVFGDYEADVLRRHGGYSEDEVEVTGAPRIAFVAGGLQSPIDPEQRDDVRRRLGVAPGDRLLVISTTHEPMHRRFYWANCLDVLLDGPLPGVHLVFKQHPSERDDGGYQALVDGIARRAGIAAPPTTVVRDIDLYTLLRAADAHLGLFSTVLTDAVAAGTPNLVATTQARQDLLGYVEAGVAVPVSTTAELREALRGCTPASPAARLRFLDQHMRPGDAPARIRDAILAATAGPHALADTGSRVPPLPVRDS